MQVKEDMTPDWISFQIQVQLGVCELTDTSSWLSSSAGPLHYFILLVYSGQLLAVTLMTFVEGGWLDAVIFGIPRVI